MEHVFSLKIKAPQTWRFIASLWTKQEENERVGKKKKGVGTLARVMMHRFLSRNGLFRIFKNKN